MDYLPRLLSLSSSEILKIPEYFNCPIVRCYRVPPHFSAELLETQIRNFFGKYRPEKVLTFRQIRSPSRMESWTQNSWKLLCADECTAESLLAEKCIKIMCTATCAISDGTKSQIGRSDIPEKKVHKLYFCEGNKLDLAYPMWQLPIPVIKPSGYSVSTLSFNSSSGNSASCSIIASSPHTSYSSGSISSSTIFCLPFIGSSITDDSALYWLDDSSRKSRTTNHSMSIYPNNSGCCIFCPPIMNSNNTACTNINSYTSSSSTNVGAFVETVWPKDIPWRDISQQIKRKLCIVVRNKPPEWEAPVLEEFLNKHYSLIVAEKYGRRDTEKSSQCYKGSLDGLYQNAIQFIFMTKTFPKLATVACSSQLIRDFLVAISSIKLPAKWAASNISKGMPDIIQIEPYAPQGIASEFFHPPSKVTSIIPSTSLTFSASSLSIDRFCSPQGRSCTSLVSSWASSCTINRSLTDIFPNRIKLASDSNTSNNQSGFNNDCLMRNSNSSSLSNQTNVAKRNFEESLVISKNNKRRSTKLHALLVLKKPPSLREDQLIDCIESHYLTIENIGNCSNKSITSQEKDPDCSNFNNKTNSRITDINLNLNGEICTYNNYHHKVKSVLHCWPCEGLSTATIVCQSEEAKRLLLSNPEIQTQINGETYMILLVDYTHNSI